MTNEEAKLIVLQRYNEGVQNLAHPFKILKNRSIVDYKNHMTARLNGDIEHLNLDVERPVVFHVARALTRSYLSKVAANPVEMTLKTYNTIEDVYEPDLGEGLRTMLAYSNDKSNQKKAFFDKCFDATAEGTAIEFEGFRDVRRKRKVIDSFDPITQKAITKEEEIILERGCYSALRPLEDILIPNPYEEDIQKQSWIIDREIMEYALAEHYYGKTSNFSEVEPGAYHTGEQEMAELRQDLIPQLQGNQVEIIHYYNLEGDYIRLINGVVNYNSVNPYRHGKYPYAKTIYDKFSGAPFFYGRSFVEQIEGDTDAYITLHNLILEKQYLATIAFMMAENEEDFMEIGEIKNGRVLQVTDVNKQKIEKFPGIDNSDVTMLGKMEQGMESRAGNPTGGANATTPAGGRILLQQTLQMQEEAMKQIGYSIKLLEDGERDRTELRVSNLIQFYSIPEKRDLAKGKTPLIYSTIRQENQRLSDGTLGMKIIKIIDNRNEKSLDKVKQALDMEEASYDGNAEAVAFSVKDFDQIETMVSVVPKSSYATSQATELQKWTEYIQTRLAIMPESNREALMQKLDEIMNVDGSKYNPPAQPPQAGMVEQLMGSMQGGQEQAQPQNSQTQANAINNF